MRATSSTPARTLACALVLTTLGARFPGATPERWTALSTTAISITGDVLFTPSRIVFANGAALAIAYRGTVRSARWADAPSAGARIALYRVARGADPTLLRGNRLCGTRPTYLSVSRTRDAPSHGRTDLVEVAVFSGPRPQGRRSDELCATYAYEAQARAR